MRIDVPSSDGRTRPEDHESDPLEPGPGGESTRGSQVPGRGYAHAIYNEQ